MIGRRGIRAALVGVIVTATAAMVPACGGQPPEAADALGAAESAVAPVHTQRACAAAPGKVACGARVVGDAKPLSGPTGFGAPDLQSAYNVTGAAPAVAPTIAIVVAYDDSHAESDLSQYRATYGLPPCTSTSGCFKKVNQTGAASPLPAASPSADDWSFDDSLGLDVASAICPSCKLLLVEANDDQGNGLYVSVNTAVTLGASVVSLPWGISETSSDLANNSYFNHPGVAIFSSVGDSPHVVDFPASSPYVIAVGGTTLTKSALARGWSEVAWNQGGSGCSQFEAKPSWQKDTGCAKRTTVDVAAVADPSTPVAIYDSTEGGWIAIGGTDVAVNVVAAIFARTGHAAASAALAYDNPSAFYDVTAGTTGTCTPAYLCAAGVGYDGPTGIGTPNAAALAGLGSAPPICVHSDCTTGAKLASGCDPCVTAVCARDSYCCATAWDSTCVGEVASLCGKSCGSGSSCAHSDCAPGAKLTASCDPCVAKICVGDPYCCSTAWDAQCVGEVKSICAQTCN